MKIMGSAFLTTLFRISADPDTALAAIDSYWDIAH
jgi:hypothetical protein